MEKGLIDSKWGRPRSYTFSQGRSRDLAIHPWPSTRIGVVSDCSALLGPSALRSLTRFPRKLCVSRHYLRIVSMNSDREGDVQIFRTMGSGLR